MPHILVAGKIHEAGMAVLRAAPDVTYDLVEAVSLESYLPYIAKADGLLIRTQPMPASAIEAAPRLKIVSRHGVGYDAVDINALNARGIPLTIVGDVNSRSVAEQTLMFMLALAKRTLAYDDATRHDWGFRNSFAATELADKTLMLIGFGRIGRMVAKFAAALDMQIMAYDPFIGADQIRVAGAQPVVSIVEGLQLADYVSVHIPKADKVSLIGEEELGVMKSSAFIINTARGGLVDETALAQALNAGRIAGAGLDVFGDEPPAKNHPLFACRNVIFSPHSAGLTEEAAARMGVSSVQNILDFFAGRLDPALVVNKASLSADATKMLKQA